ncbi:respiratory chain complex I subunit 1 family protein [Azospirillum halopraeferens]|uniref:respiratory chain complex I subunit 1 family protein n=1 Tax=Azospirillum halopraeferens TaxID=34010 RepID=UPI0003F57166|nr:respiratory chain complex I subunit 1 family protein [Azospirillum halopraeferens]
MTTLSFLILAVLQALLLLLAAPLLSGFTRVMRARMHSRRGPGLLQDYRDILKLLKRQDVTPPASGIVFRAMPYIQIATMLLVAMALPVLTRVSPVGGAGDLITVIYLFALSRFFFSLSGIDSGSSFAGIGASREMTMAILIEPIMLLALMVTALLAGSTNIAGMGTAIAEGTIHAPLAAILCAVAFAFASYAEMGKLPFDMAEAEQELQEGPLTEYSGPSFALLKWGLSLKQVVVVALFLSVFVPFGSPAEPSFLGLIGGLAVFAVKIVAAFAIAALIENSMARGRFLMTARVTWAGFGTATLAFVFFLAGL